jgi:hypothetical protein
MDRLLVDRFFVMALDALCNSNALVIFPVCMGMDVCMTIRTRNALFCMDTGVMLGILLFVATLALHLLDFDLFFHVLGEIGNIHVATGAGVLAMDRCCKITNRHFVTVASQARGWVDSHPLLGGYRQRNCYKQKQ